MTGSPVLTALLVLAYFALLAWTLKRRGPALQGPWFFFLRAFFPNWKFFHAVGRAPRLYVRGQDAQGSWSDWQLVYPRLPRRLSHLWHNPAVNLALTHQNLVDHLAGDINQLPEGDSIAHSVSYQLVTRLSQGAVQGGRWGEVPMLASALPTCIAFQFEVRMERPDLGEGSDSVQMLLSPVTPLLPTPAQEGRGSPSPDPEFLPPPLGEGRDGGTRHTTIASRAPLSPALSPEGRGSPVAAPKLHPALPQGGRAKTTPGQP